MLRLCLALILEVTMFQVSAVTTRVLTLVLGISFMMSSAAQAVSFRSPSPSEVAQQLVERGLFDHDFRTVTTDLDDVSNCGLRGPGTLVEVQVLQKSQSSSSNQDQQFVTVKSYVVNEFGSVVDSANCQSNKKEK